jgi:hypothetical protein
MKDGASNLTWGWFFFTYLFQWIFVGIMVLGYPGLGGVGIWTASVIVKDSKGPGIVCWSCALLWVALFLFQGYHFKRALSIFKSAGGVSAPLTHTHMLTRAHSLMWACTTRKCTHMRTHTHTHTHTHTRTHTHAHTHAHTHTHIQAQSPY